MSKRKNRPFNTNFAERNPETTISLGKQITQIRTHNNYSVAELCDILDFQPERWIEIENGITFALAYLTRFAKFFKKKIKIELID